MEAVVDFRVARPSNDLARLRQFYVDGLSLEVLAEFVGHEGFDGLILSLPDGHTQIEFTKAAGHVAPRAPTEDHLLVFYIDSVSAHTAAVLRMQAHGFEPVRSFNPYWDRHGVTFEDPEGYRVVIVRGAYPLTEPAGD
ncbi:MAG: VOC family protein [Alphaproteobacteria bacterium]|nr:VOC family protein [Alphaproteobacteria bacterium]